jgi:hypothetical protein
MLASEIQKAFVEVERRIAEGKRLWGTQEHMQKLYDAQMKGAYQAKVDIGKASSLGTDLIQFMRSQLQAMGSSSAWSMPQSSSRKQYRCGLATRLRMTK